MELTLVIIKPDAILRELSGEIINRFVRRGLKIAGMKMMQLTKAQMEEHYAHHVTKPFFPALAEGMMRTPVIAVVLAGRDAVAAARAMAGATNCAQAASGTIRGDLGMSFANTLVHISDSPESAAAEVARFFNKDEIFLPAREALDPVYSEEEIVKLV